MHKNGVLFILIGIVQLMSGISCSDSDGGRRTSEDRRRRSREPFSILRNDDCFTCHNLYDKAIGPAYIDIARKYEADPATIDRISDKIIEGGGGLWGGALMSKHPLLKKQDVESLVTWILNLDSEEANQYLQAPGLNIDSIVSTTQDRQNGLSVSIAGEELHIAIPFVDLKSDAAFLPAKAGDKLLFEGNIYLEKRGVYLFRLQKEGKAELKLDGLSVIAARPDDQEINLRLEAGIHPMSVEYQLPATNSFLSLQWIPPGEEYYRPVPSSVLTPAP